MSLGEPIDVHELAGPAVEGRVVTLIVVHHSASPDTTTPEEIVAWHRARGFKDAGYHFLIYRDARGVWVVKELRAASEPGAHVHVKSRPGLNAHSIGICVAGDYTRQPLEPVARGHLLATLTWCCRALGLAPSAVYGHRELAATACPGFAMDPIRDALALALST